MNALAKMAHSAYSSLSTSTRSYRCIEYEILSRITHELIHTSSAKDNYGALVGALHRNRRLWRIFRDDISDPQNTLPEELRNGLYQLACFVETETGKILSGGGNHQVLVDINRSVMRGLLPSKGREA